MALSNTMEVRPLTTPLPRGQNRVFSPGTSERPQRVPESHNSHAIPQFSCYTTRLLSCLPKRKKSLTRPAEVAEKPADVRNKYAVTPRLRKTQHISACARTIGRQISDQGGCHANCVFSRKVLAKAKSPRRCCCFTELVGKERWLLEWVQEYIEDVWDVRLGIIITIQPHFSTSLP